MNTTIGPASFNPYRAEIRDCYCVHCVALAYLVSLDSGRHSGGTRHLELAQELLEALEGGTHTHVTAVEYAASLPAYEGRGYVTCKL